MKQFLLFTGPHYYPDGGWYDFMDSYDTFAEARASGIGIAARNDWWAHVVDTATGTMTIVSDFTL